MSITFDEAIAILDAAIAAESNTTKLTCTSHKEATNIRHRLNHWRSQDREQNKEIYQDRDHPLYGKSAYDALTLRVPRPAEPDSHCIFLERRPKLVLEEIQS